MQLMRPGGLGLVLALALAGLAGCCVEESSTFVFMTPEMDEAVARACRVSSEDFMSATLDRAVETYHGYLTYDPKRTCALHPGTLCEFAFPCDHPPDMNGAPHGCPPPPPPPRRYYACLGCGRQPPRTQRDSVLLLPHTSALLDVVVQKTGATSREEALYKSILHFEKIWIEERQKPDFGSRRYQRTKHRKPGQPCWGQPTPQMLRDTEERLRREAEAASHDMGLTNTHK